MFGICNLSVVPCRKEPSDKSEMVTQLLFGEHFEILEEKKSWTLIRIAYDGYECWIDKKQFLPLNNIKGISDSTSAVTTDLIQLTSPKEKEQNHIPILLGSSLPKYFDKEFSLGKEKYSFEGEVIFPFAKKSKSPSFGGVEKVSNWYLNTPYLWGGRSPFGIDCSGFTQMVFKLNGIHLKRDAKEQAEQGKAIEFFEDGKTGDLAFFDNEDGKIIHVGIVLTPLSYGRGVGGEVIHASGKVRIDKLDHHGIYNEEIKKYTHRLRIVRRYI